MSAEEGLTTSTFPLVITTSGEGDTGGGATPGGMDGGGCFGGGVYTPQTEYYGGCQVGLGFEQVLNSVVDTSCNLQALEGGVVDLNGGQYLDSAQQQNNQALGGYHYDPDGLGVVQVKQEQPLPSFESSLITLSDINNYQTSGLDWMETGVSNWLSFDQNASLGFPEMSQSLNPAGLGSTSKQSTSSLYNFYGEDETQYQSAIGDMEVDDEDIKNHLVAPPAAVEGVQLLEIGVPPPAIKQEDVKQEVESDEDEDDDDDEEEDDDEGKEEEHLVNPGETETKSKPKSSFVPQLCPQCVDRIEFTSPKSFESHMKTEHDEDFPYICPTCGKSFAKSYQVIAHEKIHDPDRYKGEPQWLCALCDKKYHVRVSLYAHYKTSHPGEKPPKPDEMAKLRKKLLTSPVQQTPEATSSSRKPTLKKKKKLKRKKSVTEALPPPPPPSQCPDAILPNLTTDVSGPLSISTQDSRPGHYPCQICGKVFTMPCNLRDHFLLHTGEKPQKCPYCPQAFRLKHQLTAHVVKAHPSASSILKMYKCRVCGVDIPSFAEMYNHRTRKHPEVPYDKEKEKTFACGVCSKPHNLREEAVMCAVWGHDPTKLQEMFQYKCPRCPEESLGYFKKTYLKNHWDDEHPTSKVPPLLRKGVVGNTLDENSLKWENLPFIKIPKEKAQEVREKGLPQEISFDYLWYKDLTEFPPSEKEHHWMAMLMLDMLEQKRGSPGGEGPHVCTICGDTLSKRGNFRRHLTVVHIRQEMLSAEEQEKLKITGRAKETEPEYLVVNGKKKRVKVVYMTDSEEEEEYIGVEEEDQKKEGNAFKCQFCNKSFPKKRALQFHEVRGHINPKPRETPKTGRRVARGRNGIRRSRLSISSPSCNEESESEQEQISSRVGRRRKKISSSVVVNVKDAEAVKALLGNRVVKIMVSPVKLEPQELSQNQEPELAPVVKRELKTEPMKESGQLPVLPATPTPTPPLSQESPVGEPEDQPVIKQEIILERRSSRSGMVTPVVTAKKKAKSPRVEKRKKPTEAIVESVPDQKDSPPVVYTNALVVTTTPTVVVRRKEDEDSERLKASLKLEQVTRMLSFVKRS